MPDAKGAPQAAPEWIERHWRVWEQKPALRRYYEEEYYKRIVAAMPEGRSLEIGAGPGFFARYRRCDVVSDISPAPHLDQVVDVHAMPFDTASFDCVVGIDVVHHFAHPARALAEIGRVLRPGGRLILVEPWTGPVGVFVNRYLHDEDCFSVEDPWGPVFTGGKNPMDGNAMVPRMLFETYAGELPVRAKLRVRELVPFSCLGFLATGGFTRWQLPAFASDLLARLERGGPQALWRFAAIKVFIVAARVET